MLGGDAIMAAVSEHTGLHHSETSADGKVSLEHLECNAACDYAPVMMVNWEFYDDQTVAVARPNSSTGSCAGDPAATHRRGAVEPGARSGRRPACWPASPTGGRT